MADHSHPHAGEPQDAPHQQHAHSHANHHSHSHHHNGQPDTHHVNPTPRATLLALSAVQRVGYAMPLIALLWLGLLCTIQAGE